MPSQRNSRIADRILFYFIPVALVPLVVVALIAYGTFTATVRKEVQNNLVNLSLDRADEIETHIKERKRSVALLGKTPSVMEALGLMTEIFLRQGMESPEYLRIDNKIRPYLTYYADKFDYYDLFLISPKGDIVFSLAREEAFGTNLSTGPGRESEAARVFRRASTLLETDISDFASYPGSVSPVAFIAAPLLDKQGFLGVVAVKMGAGRIDELARNYTGLGETGEIITASSNGGRIVFRTPTRHDPEKEERRVIDAGSLKSLPLQEAVQGKNGAGVYEDYRGKKVLAAWRYLPHLRWGMVVKIDVKEAFKPVERLTELFILLGITALAAVMLTALFVSRTISRPIVKLTDATKSMAEGDLDVTAEVESFDEIGTLALTFNHMVKERRKAEDEVSRLRNLLSNIVDSMPSVLVGVDREIRVTHWNREAEKVTGLNSGEVKGRPLYELLPHLAGEIERARQVISNRRPMKASRVGSEVAGKTLFSDVTIYPLVANGVEGGVIRVDDVTERVRMEEMMIQSEKMLSVGGLAAGMAHEINNPLAGILQNALVMKSRMADDIPKNRRAAEKCGTTLAAIESYMAERRVFNMLENIISSGRRAADIVENMLAFCSGIESEIAYHDLKELLDRTVDLAGSDYDLKARYDFREIGIIREYDTDLPRVMCRGGKIQQVFLNILKNAAQAMYGQEEQAEPPRFTLRLAREEKWARIEIEDNGSGMDEAVRRRVFEPFFTTRDVDVGTGLGLAISYFIITTEHDGTMGVDSAPGRGANFIIRLPIDGNRSARPARGDGKGAYNG